MSLPQRSTAPALPRQATYGRPPMGARPLSPRPLHPGTGQPMAAPVLQRPAPRPVRFLTVTEVAAIMRVSKMTVYRLVHGGELPAARVGRSFRVPRHAVEEYLRSAYFDVG